MSTFPSSANIPGREPEHDDGIVIDLASYYHLLREKAWIIVSCVLVALTLGGAYIMHTRKVYAATAEVEVNQEQNKVVNIQNVTSEDLSSLELLKTIEANLSSRTLMERVVDRLQLNASTFNLPPNPTVPYTKTYLAEQLQKTVRVNLIRGTRLIDVTVENTNPEAAQNIAGAIVSEYIESNHDYQISVATEANKFLSAQAATLQQQLGQSKQALQDYKEQHQAVSLDGAENITAAKLNDLNEKLTAAKEERLKLESDEAQVEKLAGHPPEDFLAISSVADAQSVIEADKQVMAVKAEIGDLSQRYLPKHPKYIQAMSALKEVQGVLDHTIMEAADAVGTQYRSALDTENKLAEALHDQEQSAMDLTKLAIPYELLQQQVDSNQALFDSVLSRLKETDVTKNLEDNSIRILELPALPEKPAKPRRTLIMITSLFTGLVVGVLICFGLNMVDSSFKTIDQAETALELPAVAAVPRGKEGNSYDSGFVIINEPHGAIAESFRTLRTALSLLGRESERCVFLFTSAVPGEGKSFCSTNYAISLAQLGQRTLLIDSDLRLPTIGRTFFKNAFHAGVSDVLIGNVPLSEACQPSSVDLLDVMTAGHRPPNPAELLSGNAFADLIREARTKYDRIVIDSAPVNAVSDTLLLLRYAQTVCLVIHSGKTARRAVERAVLRLTQSGSRPVGFIMNRMPEHSGADYYYHYSAGEYGKGVYGAPPADAT
jgi:capsular exopolysaccharide synthesis family protein